jgi:hypothetical protein
LAAADVTVSWQADQGSNLTSASSPRSLSTGHGDKGRFRGAPAPGTR